MFTNVNTAFYVSVPSTKPTSDELSESDRAAVNLLDVIESGEPLTQRSLVVRLGVALRMTNSHVELSTIITEWA